jgi:hypothetical protein
VNYPVCWKTILPWVRDICFKVNDLDNHILFLSLLTMIFLQLSTHMYLHVCIHIHTTPLLTPLETIDLSFTNFRGTIPTAIGQLNNLGEFTFNQKAYIYIYIYAAHYLISSCWLFILVYFTIGPGNFRGTIPSEIGKCTNVQTLTLSNSMISGELPMEVVTLPNLKSLDVSFNSDLFVTIALFQKVNYATTLEFMNLTRTNIQSCPTNNFCSNSSLEIHFEKGQCDCKCCD